MPLLDKKSTFAAKIETTAGTAISLAAADGTINYFNAQIIDSTEYIERFGQVSYDRIAGSIGGRMGQATFQTDLVPGSGAHPAWASVLLPACGLVASTDTYTPRTEPAGSSVKTLTMAKYTNGIYEQIHGAMGTFRITFVAGRPPIIDWTFTGCYTKASDVSLIQPTYVTTNPLRFISSALAVGSYTPKVESLTLDIGNDIALLPDSRSATGYSHANIRDRNVTITMNPETALVASQPFQTDFENRIGRAISWALSESNLGISFSAPNCQLAAPPAPGERGGARIEDLVFSCLRSNTGSPPLADDSISIVFDTSP